MASLASISWWHCSNFDSVPPLRILVLLQVDRLIVLSSIIRHAPPPPGPLGPNPKLLKPSAILLFIYVYIYVYIYIWDKEKSEKARHVAFPVSSLGALWGDSSSLCFEVSRKS